MVPAGLYLRERIVTLQSALNVMTCLFNERHELTCICTVYMYVLYMFLHNTYVCLLPTDSVQVKYMYVCFLKKFENSLNTFINYINLHACISTRHTPGKKNYRNICDACTGVPMHIHMMVQVKFLNVNYMIRVFTDINEFQTRV